jgi:hypothetical protein
MTDDSFDLGNILNNIAHITSSQVVAYVDKFTDDFIKSNNLTLGEIELFIEYIHPIYFGKYFIFEIFSKKNRQIKKRIMVKNNLYCSNAKTEGS